MAAIAALLGAQSSAPATAPSPDAAATQAINAMQGMAYYHYLAAAAQQQQQQQAQQAAQAAASQQYVTAATAPSGATYLTAYPVASAPTAGKTYHQRYRALCVY